MRELPTHQFLTAPPVRLVSIESTPDELARPRTRGNATFNATREAVLAALGDARPPEARLASEVAPIR
jgi:hypothetical protein